MKSRISCWRWVSMALIYTEQVFGSQAGISNCLTGVYERHQSTAGSGADSNAHHSLVSCRDRRCVAYQHNFGHMDCRELQNAHSIAVPGGKWSRRGARKSAAIQREPIDVARSKHVATFFDRQWL